MYLMLIISYFNKGCNFQIMDFCDHSIDIDRVRSDMNAKVGTFALGGLVRTRDMSILYELKFCGMIGNFSING